MKTYTGINIQYPISQLILNREKSIETRTYPIPSKYLNQDLLMIETPGKSGKFKSRIVGVIRFDFCRQYRSAKDFYQDYSRHQVSRNSPWAYQKEKGKWGWNILEIHVLKKPIAVRKRLGIRFTKGLTL